MTAPPVAATSTITAAARELVVLLLHPMTRRTTDQNSDDAGSHIHTQTHRALVKLNWILGEYLWADVYLIFLSRVCLHCCF